jgi:hypothetical protein
MILPWEVLYWMQLFIYQHKELLFPKGIMKYCITLMENIYISRIEVQRCSLEFVISPFLEYKFGIWGLRFEQG